MNDKLAVAIIIALSIGIPACGAGLVLTFAYHPISWSFDIPKVDNATIITTNWDGGLIHPYRNLPYTVTGSSLAGSTVHLRVWYYEASPVSGSNISGVPVQVAYREYSFEVTSP